jgi:hypothetical protein
MRPLLSNLSRGVPVVGVLAALLLAPQAQACAACACGDPTLTTLGADQPFAGRVRVASSVRGWGYSDTVSGAEVGELRLDLGAAYSPLEWLTLSAQLPLQARQSWGLPGGGQSFGPGDLTLTGRAMIWRDRPFASRWLFGGLAGLVLPTAVGLPDTAAIPPDSPLTLGEGALSPLAGLSLLMVEGPWSAFASVTGALPVGADAPGPAVRTSLFAQRQLWPSLAVRLGAEARVDAPVTPEGPQALGRVSSLASAATYHAMHEGEHHGGGLGVLSFATADLLFKLATDAQLQVGLRWPAFVVGTDRPWPLLQTGLAIDL